MSQEIPETIDFTPTWGEWANMYRRFAENSQGNACRELRPDFANAMAAAQALKEIRATLTAEQAESVSKTIAAELKKQGY